MISLELPFPILTEAYGLLWPPDSPQCDQVLVGSGGQLDHMPITGTFLTLSHSRVRAPSVPSLRPCR